MTQGDPVESDDDEGRALVDGVPELQVLTKSVNILETFSSLAPELSIRELSVATGIPTSTCVRIVRNLVHHGMLERVDDKYRVGLTIVRWAGEALSGLDLVKVAREPLRRLRDRTGESTLLSVREGKQAVVVAIANSHHSVIRQLRVGEVNVLNAGASGKVLLAYDDEAFELVRRSELEARTPNTVTDLKQLSAALELIRKQGFAATSEERHQGAAGCAAPVFDGEGRIVASVGISGPVSRMTPEKVREYSGLVVATATEISRGLGHPLGID